jgi:hypothetical protein
VVAYAEVQKVLEQRCYMCHGAAGADEERAAGFRPEPFKAARPGGLPAGRGDQDHADEQRHRHHRRRARADRALVANKAGALVKSGILEKEKIALVGYRTTEIRPDVPYLYSVRAGLRDEITKIAEHLATVGITRLGLFHEDGPGAAALTSAVDEITKKTGSTIAARATYPAGTARVSPAIETFLKTPPQAIIMLATGSAAAGFIEQYRLAGGAAQLFAQSGADIEQLAQRLGEETMQGIAIAQVTPTPALECAPHVQKLLLLPHCRRL